MAAVTQTYTQKCYVFVVNVANNIK